MRRLLTPRVFAICIAAFNVGCLGECKDAKVAGLGMALHVTRRRLAYIHGEERYALDLLVGASNSSVTLKIPREDSHV